MHFCLHMSAVVCSCLVAEGHLKSQTIIDYNFFEQKGTQPNQTSSQVHPRLHFLLSYAIGVFLFVFGGY